MFNSFYWRIKSAMCSSKMNHTLIDIVIAMQHMQIYFLDNSQFKDLLLSM